MWKLTIKDRKLIEKYLQNPTYLKEMARANKLKSEQVTEVLNAILDYKKQDK